MPSKDVKHINESSVLRYNPLSPELTWLVRSLICLSLQSDTFGHHLLLRQFDPAQISSVSCTVLVISNVQYLLSPFANDYPIFHYVFLQWSLVWYSYSSIVAFTDPSTPLLAIKTCTGVKSIFSSTSLLPSTRGNVTFPAFIFHHWFRIWLLPDSDDFSNSLQKQKTLQSVTCNRY